MVADLDSDWALKTVYMPNVEPSLAAVWVDELSAVHPIIAQDMQWVVEAWKKRGETLAEYQTSLDAKRDQWDLDHGESMSWRAISEDNELENGTMFVHDPLYSQDEDVDGTCFCEQRFILWRERVDDLAELYQKRLGQEVGKMENGTVLPPDTRYLYSRQNCYFQALGHRVKGRDE